MNPFSLRALLALGFATVAVNTQAQIFVLQNATATFSQSGYDVGQAIDGTTADDRGWAILPGEGSAQTAVFETQSDIGFAGGSALTFTFESLYLIPPGHNLGRFRLSITTDDRSTFADGLATGGDVTANWITLDPATFFSVNGQTLAKQGDNSLLASGLNPATDTLTVTAPTSLTGITGLRLEMIPDASLPAGGSGRFGNGNFVLSELTVSITAVPEPEFIAGLSAAGLLGWALLARRRSNRR